MLRSLPFFLPSDELTVTQSASREDASSSTERIVKEEEEEEEAGVPIVTAIVLLGLDVAMSSEDEGFHTPRSMP